jgi:hypothetical protein
VSVRPRAARAGAPLRPIGPPPDAAATLHLVRENLRLLTALSRRYEVSRLDWPPAPAPVPDALAGTPAGRAFRSAREVAAYLGPELAYLAQEQLRALLLTSRHTLIACALVAQGTVDATACRVADGLREAVRAGAAAVVFAHNHPSGDPSPSAGDVRFTDDAARAGALLGIDVVDHVVIGRGPGPGDPVLYASLRQLGLFLPGGDVVPAAGGAATRSPEARAGRAAWPTGPPQDSASSRRAARSTEAVRSRPPRRR